MHRAINLSGKGVPNTFKEILTEFASNKNSATEMRSGAIKSLFKIDIDLAERQWRDLLINPTCVGCAEESAYLGLASIAEMRKKPADGIFWIDRYINSRDYVSPFSPRMWKWFADLPEGDWRSRSRLTDAYAMRMHFAIASGDFGKVKESIEDMLGFAEDCKCGVTPIRLALLQLAEAEINKGHRQEPLRILGYVATQPLDAYLTAQVDQLRKKLGSEPKREDSPWDSPARATKPRRPPTADPGIKTTGSKT